MPWPKKQSIDDSEKLYAKPGLVIEVELLEDEPELYFTHFVGGKSVKCGAPDCDNCLKGERQQTKGSIKVRDMADGKEKRLNGTAALFYVLKDTLDLCGGRKGFSFAIKATGEKAQRRYTIVNKPIKANATVQPESVEETPF